jgi:hypothetical protein
MPPDFIAENPMRRLSLICLALTAMMLAACQGTPPTQIVLVVTATPEEASTPAEPTQTAEADATEDPTLSPTAEPTSAALVDTGPTLTPSPTPIVNQIQVAEQVFERGRMFWIQPTGQIWVMVVTDEGQGDWAVFADTYEDGDPETDPALTPPSGLEQPRRGFGKLWRENPEINEALGWAVTPEFGFVSRYEYHCLEETAAQDGTLTCQRGYHVLTSLYEETFRFNEGVNTWQLN